MRAQILTTRRADGENLFRMIIVKAKVSESSSTVCKLMKEAFQSLQSVQI